MKRHATRIVLLLLSAVLAATSLVLPGSPAHADTATSRTIQGSGSNTLTKEWFNTPFSAGLPFGGSIDGKIRFKTDTTTTLSNTRTLGVNPMGTVDGGPDSALLTNTNTTTKMDIKSRPALDIVYEYAPDGDAQVCNTNDYPNLNGDWRGSLSVPAGSNHRCGAIEITADDLNPIFIYYGIDLRLPEVFQLFNQFIDPGYLGSRTYSETHQLFEIHVCEMVSKAFALPIGDHCSFQINAVVNPTLSAAPGHTAKVQYCLDGTLNGNTYPCLFPMNNEKTVVWSGPSKSVTDTFPCGNATNNIGVRIKDPEWDVHVDSIAINVSIDFNVNLTENGDGWDLATINIPTGIDLIDSNNNDTYQDIKVTYPGASSTTFFNIGTLVPDQTAPFVAFMGPASVEERLTSTVSAVALDNCDSSALQYKWQYSGQPIVNKTGDNTYSRFFPVEGTSNGTVKVTDTKGNASALVPANITIVNGPPDVTLNAPVGIPVGTNGQFSAPVVDEGPDVETWNWNFGDGTTASRVGGSTTDRNDTRNKAYSQIGRYVVTANVSDDDVTTTKKSEVGVFQPGSAFQYKGNFTTATGSVGTGNGTPFSASVKAQYDAGNTTPTGSFAMQSQIPIGGGEYVPANVTSTSLNWLLMTPTSIEVQGPATMNNTQNTGWTVRATYTRASATAPVTKVNVKVWEPGKSPITDAPYYVFNSTNF